VDVGGVVAAVGNEKPGEPIRDIEQLSGIVTEDPEQNIEQLVPSQHLQLGLVSR